MNGVGKGRPILKKPKIRFGCYFCEKGIKAKALAVDDENNVIMAKENSGLTDDDSHFICKKCYEKVKTFFETN